MRLPITNQLIIIIITTLPFSHFCSAAAVGDTLTPSTPLYSGNALISHNGTFTLDFFTPNNSSNLFIGIRYHKIATHDIVWVANRAHPVSASDAASAALTLNPNGTLLIVNRDSSIIFWSSPSTQNRSVAVANPVAQLLDTGNLVIRDAGRGADDYYIWQSFDYPTDTLLAGMKLGWDLRSGLNRNVTSWSSASDPSPGPYVGGINLRGVPQLAITKGGKWYTRGGPWVGIGWTGTPQMSKSNSGAINAMFVANSEEVYYSFEPVDSVVSRTTMKSEGVAERSVWSDQLGEWRPFWRAPEDECDPYSVCGPYGICNASSLPVPCSCLQGFRTKNQASWAMSTWSDGCVRKTALDCPRRDGSGGSSDVFVTVPRAKLPDTAAAAVEDKSLGLRECKERCLMNCSCTAYSSANLTAVGSGCIMWTGELNDLRTYDSAGQDLYLRLAASEIEGSNSASSQSHQNKKIAAIVVPIAVSSFISTLLIGCLIIRHCQMKKKKRTLGSFEGDNEGIGDDKDIELPLFDFSTIVEATNNFCQQNKLGEGGFGPVYMGRTADGQEIAVKRLSKSSSQGIDEFKNEVMFIAKLQHRNLVRLIGCCVQRQERLLIYEYMPNKSLDTFLFDEEKKMSLYWQLRFRIIVGIARGLLYLHQDSPVTIVHRDLKASNVLLNEEMVPKISDFGLARCGGDEAKSTKRVMGTYGYMSPEYVIEGLFCVKSDVFSFGVLMLEIISGQKNRVYFTNQSYYQLLGQAWSLWKEGNALQLLDTAIDNTLSITEVLRCIKIGLLCVQEQPKERPLMSSVVWMLTTENEVVEEPAHPGFVARRQPITDSFSRKPEFHSENVITSTSALIGR